MAKKVRSYVLYDSTESVPYERYVDWCKTDGTEPQGENSAEYWEYVSIERDSDWRCFIEDLKYNFDGGSPVLITGKIELWNGTKEIYPTISLTLENAIRRCSKSADDMKVTFNDGIFEVEAYHHDGTNCFEIHSLSQKGLSVVEKWGDWCEDVEVKNYWFKKIKEK